MCFSASASFAAGAVLGVVGITTLKNVRSPSQLLFASIPLLFAVQQIIEGIVWLSLTNGNFTHWERFGTLGFLFFAQVVWPLMVPLSVWLLEKEERRKKILMAFTAMGTTVSAYLAWCLVVYPVTAEIQSHHIHYSLNFPIAIMWLSSLCYFLPTVVAPMISSQKSVPVLGIASLLSYIFTKIMFTNYLLSVWCFFAAIISVLVLYIVVTMNRPAPAKPGFVTTPGMM